MPEKMLKKSEKTWRKPGKMQKQPEKTQRTCRKAREKKAQYYYKIVLIFPAKCQKKK